MSEPAASSGHPGAAGPGGSGTRASFGERLRDLLGPRREERRGRGELRLVESAVLVLVGLVLLVATVNDVHRQVRIGNRLDADLESWRALTGVAFHNPFIEQDIHKYSTRDVVCADLTIGKPEGKPQACLIFTGPVRAGRRQARGGFYLVAKGTDIHEPVLDRPQYRYACFGSAVSEHLCALAKPPPGVPTRPLVGTP
jgi:hypothetical protein